MRTNDGPGSTKGSNPEEAHEGNTSKTDDGGRSDGGSNPDEILEGSANTQARDSPDKQPEKVPDLQPPATVQADTGEPLPNSNAINTEAETKEVDREPKQHITEQQGELENQQNEIETLKKIQAQLKELVGESKQQRKREREREKQQKEIETLKKLPAQIEKIKQEAEESKEELNKTMTAFQARIEKVEQLPEQQYGTKAVHDELAAQHKDVPGGTNMKHLFGMALLFVCFAISISLWTGIGESRNSSEAPRHKLTVVTFAREAYEQSQRVLPEMLAGGEATAISSDVTYKLLTGDLDVGHIPPSHGYIVVIGYDARNSILEDMDGSMGSRKRQTIVGLQERGDVLVIYDEQDHRLTEPTPHSLYNTHLGRTSTHPILSQLVHDQRFLTLHQWQYTPYQAKHIRTWFSQL